MMPKKRERRDTGSDLRTIGVERMKKVRMPAVKRASEAAV
ncbi:hypothetical protein PAENIP36_41150 [Paenibacillus sp. P36]